MGSSSLCVSDGGCPSDYIAVSISLLSLLLLLARATIPFLLFKVPLPKGSGFWIPAIQVFASCSFILSIVMRTRYLEFKRRHWWQSCFIWAAWFEGALGFGLLLSCRIVQALQLYYIFVKKRLPAIRLYIFLPLILLPWIGAAVFVHTKKPLNPKCHIKNPWIIPMTCLHISYVAALMGLTRAIRHIEFRFHELEDLRLGVFVSASSIGIWVVAYILNEIYDEIAWLEVSSRLVLLISASILILGLFSMSSSQPLISQTSLSRREVSKFETMGHALGIPDVRILSQEESPWLVDSSEPLDKLLQNRRFRQSFIEFADSCFAGESVCFFDEVHELSTIPTDDSIRRIYMARHIIERYILPGSIMEVNISHRIRQEIMGTHDLTHPDLFTGALNEVMQLMKMNLAKDYWSSTFFMKFIEEAAMRSNGHELERFTGSNYSPRLSSVHGADDPFHQEQCPLDYSGRNSNDSDS